MADKVYTIEEIIAMPWHEIDPAQKLKVFPIDKDRFLRVMHEYQSIMNETKRVSQVFQRENESVGR